MNSDLDFKRRKFVGKCHSLTQEFGFSSPEVILKIINIYATSFYGSVLWDYTGQSIERMYTTWNRLIRNLWNIPNTSHRYLIEHISASSHLKSVLYKRYLTFVQSLKQSKKKCLSELSKIVIMDHGSITGQDLSMIAKDAGLDTFRIMNMSPNAVADLLEFAPVPENCEWQVNLIKELLEIRSGGLVVENISSEEIQNLINFVSTN